MNEDDSSGSSMDFFIHRIASANNLDVIWWWLSFCSKSDPRGPQFLGVALVRGFDMVSATLSAHSHGCNPGGDVRGFPVAMNRVVPDRFANRLLSIEECDEIKAIWNVQKCSTSFELRIETLMEEKLPTAAVERYKHLLAQLSLERELAESGTLSDAIEDQYTDELDRCWAAMTEEEQDDILQETAN